MTHTDVTGRVLDIVVKALAYAISTIDSLPFDQQEGSDCTDMKLLLAAMRPDAQGYQAEIMTARRHMGIDPR